MTEHWSTTYLRHVLAQTGLSPTALAGRAGLSSTTLTRPLNNRDHTFNLSRGSLEKLELTTGISFAAFSDAEYVAPDPNEAETRPAPLMVNIFNVQASAGHGSLAEDEEIIDRLSFPPDYLRRLTRTAPRHLAIIGVKGDSMEPTLKDDDIVMIDTTKTSLDYDGLFVLRWGDALLVKRLARAAEGRVRIISDNHAIYPPTELPRAEITPIGKVIWMGKKV